MRHNSMYPPSLADLPGPIKPQPDGKRHKRERHGDGFNAGLASWLLAGLACYVALGWLLYAGFSSIMSFQTGG